MAQRDEDLARFVCWKHSWRGKYRRVVVLRAQSLATLELSAEGKETNAWSLVHSTDEDAHALKKVKSGVLESVKPLGSPVDAKCGREDQEFSISAKADEKGKVKSMKFSSRYRALLLTEVQKVLSSRMVKNVPGTSETSTVGEVGRNNVYMRLANGEWLPATMHASTFGLSCTERTTMRTIWNLDFYRMGVPAFHLLQATDTSPLMGTFAILSADDAVDGPRAAVFACENRPRFLNMAIAAAQEHVGVQLRVFERDEHGQQLSVDEFRETTERYFERIMEDEGEIVLGEWTALRVLDSAVAEDEDPLSYRKLVLTQQALYERFIDSYACVARLRLDELSCVVRDVLKPQHLTLEFGGPNLSSKHTHEGLPSFVSSVSFRCAERDALLAAIVDTAESCTGHVFDVAGEKTHPGNRIWGLSQHDTEKLQLATLTHASKIALEMLVKQRRHHQSLATAECSMEDASASGQHHTEFKSNHGEEAQGHVSRTAEIDLSCATSTFFDQVRKFNACIPANGIGVTSRIEDDVVASLVVSLPPSSLPEGPKSNGVVRGHFHFEAPPGEHQQLQCAVLDCLYRIVGSVSAHAAFVSSSSGFPRLFECLLASRSDPDGGGIPASSAKLLSKIVRGHSREAAHRLVGIVSFEKERRAAEAATGPRAARLAALNPPGRLTVLFAPFMPEKPVEGQGRDPLVNDGGEPWLDDRESANLGHHPKTARTSSAREAADSVAKASKFVSAPSPLLTMSLVEVLHECCAGRSGGSTEPFLKKRLLNAASLCGRSLFSMFDHPAHRVADETAKLMKALSSTEGNIPDKLGSSRLRDCALREGATIRHLRIGIFGSNKNFGVSQALSRELLALWVDGHKPSLSMLGRVLPHGLLSFLFPGHNFQKEFSEVLELSTSELCNLKWKQFWQALSKEHLNPELIWNAKTMQELKVALESEEQRLKLARQQLEERVKRTKGSGECDGTKALQLAWNHEEFRVKYSLYSEELYVGHVFVRLLVDRAQGTERGTEGIALRSPTTLFQALMHRVLVMPPPVFKQTSRSSSGRSRLEQECQLCVRAMCVVYQQYGKSIGLVGEGVVGFFVRLLDMVASNSLRVDLMKLLSTWTCGVDMPRQIQEFVDTGGIELCVEMGMMAHIALAKGPASNTNEDEPAYSGEWYILTEDEVRMGAKGKGPYLMKELCDFFPEERDGWHLFCYAEGMEKPRRIADIRQLRWSFSDPSSHRALVEGSLAALRLLEGLAKRCSSFAGNGWIDAPQLYPPPELVARLSTPLRLSQLATLLLLSKRPDIANCSARLLKEIVVRSRTDAMGRLYATGAIHFALAYDGADYYDMAELLGISHLNQNCTLEAAAPLSGSEEVDRSSRRSILRSVLPGSLVNLLTKAGATVFSTAMCGESDAPALVWTRKMRTKRLLPAIMQHMGKFPIRVAENNFVSYEYTPIPPIRYPELDGDMWCHRFYLRPLCRVLSESPFQMLLSGTPKIEGERLSTLVEDLKQDSDRFLRALLHTWKKEQGKGGPLLSFGQAISILELGEEGGSQPITEADLKRAYRQLARKYHPDKNPEGQEKFLEVQSAFTILQEHVRVRDSEKADGQEPEIGEESRILHFDGADSVPVARWRSLLVIKAQCLLYRYCAPELMPFKYAAYETLLEDVETTLCSPAMTNLIELASGTIAVRESDKGEIQEVSDRLLHCSALSWLTCVSSPKNGDELVRRGGTPVLLAVFSKCVAPLLARSTATSVPEEMLDRNTPEETRGTLVVSFHPGLKESFVPEDVVVAVATFALRTLAGLATMHEQSKQLAGRQSFLQEVVQICNLAIAHHGSEETFAMSSLIDAALQFVSALCGTPKGQAALLQVGALAWLVPLLFLYDASAEKSPSTTEGEQQGLVFGVGGAGDLGIARNRHAMYAARTIARLAGGFLGGNLSTPECGLARAAVSAMMTPPLASRFSEINPRSFLQLLASEDLETPVVIWNHSMRIQLLNFLCEQRQNQVDAWLHGHSYEMPSKCAHFRFDALEGELVVGGIFLRVFNVQSKGGSASSHIVDPPAFANELAMSIASTLDAERASAPSSDEAKGPNKLEGVLESLYHLLVAVPNVAATLADPEIILHLASCIRYVASEKGDQFGETQAVSCIVSSTASKLALDVLVELSSHRATARVVPSAGCDSSQSTSLVVSRAFRAAFLPPTGQVSLSALRLIRMLAPSPETGWYSVHAGGAVLLLSLVLDGASDTVSTNDSADLSVHNGGARAGGSCAKECFENALASLSQLLVQHQHGAYVSHIVGQLLPTRIVDAIAEGPLESSTAAILETSDTPELVWNPRALQKTAEQVKQLATAALESEGNFEVPKSVVSSLHESNDDVVVGGIYVKRYLRQPNFPLRNPKKVSEGILEAIHTSILSYMKENAQSHVTALKVALLSDAAVALLRSQEKVVEHVISLGYASLLLGCLSTLSVVECEHQDSPDLALMVEALLCLLHQMSATLAGAEGLAASRNPELLTVIGPIATATATSVAFSSTVGHRLDGVANSSMGLEIVQRVVSEESRARDAVVKQALGMRLAESLLQELEQWHKQRSGDFHHKLPHEYESSNIRRVLAINVLTLMSSSGQYSAKVKSILAHSSVWSHYQDQQHDLFLPGGDDDDSVGGIASLASLVQSSTSQEAITCKEEEPRANDPISCEIQDSPALEGAGDPGEELGIYEDLWPDPPDGCEQGESASASKAHEDGDASCETTTPNDPEGYNAWSVQANEPTPATLSGDFLDSPDAVLEELGQAGNATAGAVNTFHEANANNHLEPNKGSVQQNAPSASHSSGNMPEVLGSSNELHQVCVQEDAAKNSLDPPMYGGADHPLG
mmetsp:Transcript_6976/g.42736  ORF Transcript_6976/g.42736 Transcript_6976/m.42736 type:complete len:2841 (-) Transcript_6976:210-8732(-)